MVNIKAGFVGAGWVGPIHMETVRRLGYPQVYAVAEINQELADSAAKKFNIAKAYGDWKDLVRDPEVNVVHVTCSNELHYPVLKMCIELGKPVICEKPITLNLNDAKELARLAKEKNVINASTFNMDFIRWLKRQKR